MNRTKKWLIAAAFLIGFAAQVKAADNVGVQINVSVSASRGVLIIGDTYYNFGALTINSSSNSAAGLTVRNNSSALIQTYTIVGGDAISDTAGTNWELATTTSAVGTNTYGLMAQFSGSRPNNTEDAWLNDNVNDDAAITCTTTILGDGSAGDEGAGVNPAADRTLWFRLHTPVSTSDAGSHTAQVTVSVL